MTPSELSVFDLDHTLVTANSSFRFCKYLARHKILPLHASFLSALYYVQYRLFRFDLSWLHQKVFRKFLLGQPMERLEAYARAFVQEQLEPLLYLPALRCLRRAQELGHLTVLLSNSPQFLVAEAARFLGISEWGATHYAVDKQNKLCHISMVMKGEEKASFVRALAQKFHLRREQITAYSDSHLDLPLLLAAGKAIAVNPDRKLLRICKQRHWVII